MAACWMAFLSDVEKPSVRTTLTYNKLGSSPNEYGQCFNLPFGMEIAGVYGWMDADGESSNIYFILRSASGTPSVEKTADIRYKPDVQGGYRSPILGVCLPPPYTYVKDTDIVIAIKPSSGTSLSSVLVKLLVPATHRVSPSRSAQVGYGVSRIKRRRIYKYKQQHRIIFCWD